jgi:hypothetical protein
MAGAACLIGVASARFHILGLLVLFAIVAIIALEFARFRRDIHVFEPSTELAVGTRSAADSFSLEFIETTAGGDEPIVLMDVLEFAPLFHYAPPLLRSRFVHLLSDWSPQCCAGAGKLTNTQNVNGAGYFELQQCCGAPGTIASKEGFFAAHRSFFVYGKGELQRLSTLFRPPAGEITLLGCKGGQCLFHVAPSVETNPIHNQ